jgi:NAD(P)-dependent dehydrogenase (short-subunit alcohol dehydrogenase family)
MAGPPRPPPQWATSALLLLVLLVLLFCRAVEIAQAAAPLLAAALALFLALRGGSQGSQGSQGSEGSQGGLGGLGRINSIYSVGISHRLVLAAAATLSAFCAVDEFLHPYFVVPAAAFRYRTALVTGANSGVGLAASRAIARGGGRVYLACRAAEKCARAAAEINAEIREIRTSAGASAAGPGRAIVAAAALDLGSAASVRAFARAFRREDMGNAPLDYLVNNAGFGVAEGRPRNADGLESGWGSMHLGHLLLTELLHAAQPTARRAAADEAAAAAAGSGFAEMLANREKMARTGMVLSMDLELALEEAEAEAEEEEREKEGSSIAGSATDGGGGAKRAKKKKKKKKKKKRFFPAGGGSRGATAAAEPTPPPSKAHCRVVFVSSATHHICEHVDCFPKGYLGAPGTLEAAARRLPSDKLGYPRAKALNLLTAAELPRRHPDWSSLSLNLGFVQTSIASWMDYAGAFMRSADVGVRPLLYAMLAEVKVGEREREGGSSGVQNGHVIHTMYTSAPALQRRSVMIDTVFWLAGLRGAPYAGPSRRRAPLPDGGGDGGAPGYYYTEEETLALQRDIWDASMLELKRMGMLDDGGGAGAPTAGQRER